MGLTDPYRCKKRGSEVLDSKEWEEVCEKTMSDIISAKFSQNDKIRRMLLDTTDTKLFEATTDGFWGIGFPLHAKNTLEEGSGANKLGSIFMALRNNYLADQNVDPNPHNDSIVSQADCQSLTPPEPDA